VGIGREAERDTIKGWKGSAKGLVKRVLWVGSRGKGSLLRDWKGLYWGTGEAEKSAEKNNGLKSEDESVGEEIGKFFNFWEGEPMGRGEYFGVG
jgi:hypothetical protein